MRWQVLLGILISVACVLVVMYKIDIRQLMLAMQSAHYLLLIPAVLVVIGSLLLRAWRWRYLLAPIKVIHTQRLLAATSVGCMANMLLPAHAGEVLRAYLVGKKEQVCPIASFGTIVVERAFDMVSILILGIPVFVFAHFPVETALFTKGLRLSAVFSVFLCVLVLGGLWLVKTRAASLLRLTRAWLAFLPERWLERLVETLQAFTLGLQGFEGGWRFVSMLALSLVLWAALAFSNIFVLQAFDIELPLSAAFFFLVVQTVAAVIPSSPGFIGTYHAAVVAGFAVFEVSRELALSVAIMMHAIFFFPFIFMGLIFLWREQLSWRLLWREKA